MSKNLKLILGLEVTPSFTQEMKDKAILGVIGKGVDLRSDKDKTKEAVEKGKNTGLGNLAQVTAENEGNLGGLQGEQAATKSVQTATGELTGGLGKLTGQKEGEQKVAQLTAENAGGLGRLVGEQEGQKEVYKDKITSAASTAEPFVVDSKVTNSIKGLAREYVALISRDGNVQLVNGGAEILGQMVKDAEKFLQEGKSSTIGHATWMAFNNLSEKQKGSLERITAISQVEAMVARSSGSTGAAVPGDPATLNSDIENVNGSMSKALSDINSLEATPIVGLDITKATGIWSALRAFAGATIGQVFPDAENKEVTKARLMFSLIARDVVRMISLSPRFAVKEQELIQSIFAGPELFNSPRQALNRITTMQTVIDKKIFNIKASLQRQPGFDKESELVEEASQLLEIKDRMNMFTFDLIPLKDVQTPEAVTSLGPQRAQVFYNSLSATERRGLPRAVKETLFEQKRAFDAKPKTKKRQKKKKN